MTKQQQKRLSVSPNGLKVLRRVRGHELANSGQPVLAEHVVNTKRDWATLSGLLARGLLSVDVEQRVRTAGAARQINASWIAS